MSKRIGTYIVQRVSGESYKAYIPKKLPPYPPLELATLYPYLERATHALAELNSIIDFLLVIHGEEEVNMIICVFWSMVQNQYRYRGFDVVIFLGRGSPIFRVFAYKLYALSKINPLQA